MPYKSRYRRRHNYNDDEDESYNNDSITLTEFKFYNTKKKVISKKILDDIENEFKETRKLISTFTKTEAASLLGLKDFENIHSERAFEIISKKIRKKIRRNIYWTNKNFAKYGIGFQFTYHPTKIYIKILEFKSTVYESGSNNKKEYEIKFTATEFCNLNNIYNEKVFLNFELTEIQRNFMHKLFYNENRIFNYFQFFNSWNEILDYIVKYDYLKNYETSCNNFDEIKPYLKKFFNTELEKKSKYQFIGSSGYREKTYHIIKVIEKRIENINYRIAVCANLRYKDELEHEFKIFKETDKEYNYIDEDRILFHSGRNLFLDLSLNSYDQGKLIVNHKLIKKMEDNIGEILNQNEIVITPMIYNFYKNRVSSFDDNEDYLTHRENLIIKQYGKLLKNGRKIKFGDTIITKRGIEISGQHFKIRFNKNFINLNAEFNQVKKALNIKDANYNFNIVYENLLQVSVINKFKTKSYTSDFKNVEFQVNNINIKVEKINNRMRINDKACRISDVYHILSKAICYNNQKEFDLYVKDVAYIGVEWMKMICDGIQLNLNNPFTGIFQKTKQSSIGNMYMRFSLLWDIEKRTHVYLLLNDKKYLIRYKGKFKRLFDYPSRTLSLETLKRELLECLNKITEKDIYEIVNNAIKEAEIIQKRGDELVANTIIDIKAKETELEIHGHKIFGYKFKGRISNIDYFIEKSSLSVYKKINGQWNQRCVVDDHTKQRIFEDRLANRLVNIYNEPKKIYTII